MYLCAFCTPLEMWRKCKPVVKALLVGWRWLPFGSVLLYHLTTHHSMYRGFNFSWKYFLLFPLLGFLFLLPQERAKSLTWAVTSSVKLNQHLHSEEAVDFLCLPTTCSQVCPVNETEFLRKKTLIITASILPCTAWHLLIPFHSQWMNIVPFCLDLKCIKCLLIMKYLWPLPNVRKNTSFWLFCIGFLEISF